MARRLTEHPDDPRNRRSRRVVADVASDVKVTWTDEFASDLDSTFVARRCGGQTPFLDRSYVLEVMAGVRAEGQPLSRDCLPTGTQLARLIAAVGMTQERFA